MSIRYNIIFMSVYTFQKYSNTPVMPSTFKTNSDICENTHIRVIYRFKVFKVFILLDERDRLQSIFELYNTLNSVGFAVLGVAKEARSQEMTWVGRTPLNLHRDRASPPPHFKIKLFL